MRSGMFLQSKSRVCAESPIHCRCPRMSHKLHPHRICMTSTLYQPFFSFHPCVSCKSFYRFNIIKATTETPQKCHNNPSSHTPSHSPISIYLHIPPSQNTQNTQKPPNHSSQPFRHRHGLIRANHCAFRFTIPHQKSLIINLSIMPAEKMSKKHQCVADGVFYAELDEVGAVFPPDSSD